MKLSDFALISQSVVLVLAREAALAECTSDGYSIDLNRWVRPAQTTPVFTQFGGFIIPEQPRS